MATEVTVAALPTCDICQMTEAHYDSKMKGRTSWANMCHRCYREHGIGRLGTGFGQRLVLGATS